MAKDNRRRDTREKIQLGGLIVKAGLRETNAAVLLGALLELATIDQADARYAELAAKGRAAFATIDPREPQLP